MNKTSIQWTNFTSNPIRYRDKSGKVVWACIKASPGCGNCYAEALANRYRKGHAFTVSNMDKFGIKPFVDEKELRKMLHYKPAAGKRCFLGDMTDIFGEWVTDEMLYWVFATMAARTDVTWQVLTKRAERLRNFMNNTATPNCVDDYYRNLPDKFAFTWPPPNIHVGVSVENDEWAGKRLPYLRHTMAAIRFVSYEPGLGPVDWNRHFGSRDERRLPGQRKIIVPPAVEWIIVGGESGGGARSFNIEWVSQTVDWCRASGVKCFVKQFGSRPYDGRTPLPVLFTGRGPRYEEINDKPIKLKDGHGGDPEEWPEDLRVREFPCPRE
jgi:protein gp37